MECQTLVLPFSKKVDQNICSNYQAKLALGCWKGESDQILIFHSCPDADLPGGQWGARGGSGSFGVVLLEVLREFTGFWFTFQGFPILVYPKEELCQHSWRKVWLVARLGWTGVFLPRMFTDRVSVQPYNC